MRNDRTQSSATAAMPSTHPTVRQFATILAIRVTPALYRREGLQVLVETKAARPGRAGGRACQGGIESPLTCRRIKPAMIRGGRLGPSGHERPAGPGGVTAQAKMQPRSREEVTESAKGMMEEGTGRWYSQAMRPLRYAINITLDGCCDHRAASTDEELHRYWAEKLAQADGLIFGRVTYEMMEAAWRWPASGVRPGWMADWMEPFARTIDAAKKYVVSSTLAQVDWNAELLRGGDLREAIGRLKASPP